MKGQGLVCQPNAKLIAVNLRYIVYAMKEGVVRIINQNGRDMFKVHNTTKAVITDMAINGTGAHSNQGTTLLCVDEAGHVSIFILEALAGTMGPERTKKVELIFPKSMQPPLRILGHPLDARLFVTVHAGHLLVWNLASLEQSNTAKQNETTHFHSYTVDDDLVASCSQQFELPSEISSGELCDAAVSANGQCLLALTNHALLIWRFSTQAEPQLLQRLSLETSASSPGLRSIRILTSSSASERSPYAPSADDAEVLVVGSSAGNELLVYELRTASKAPVGPLLQSISLVSNNGNEVVGLLDVDSVMHSSLGVAFKNKNLVLVFPLALRWSGGPAMPFTYARRFITEEPADQLSIMTGKSCQTAGLQTLFMYRAHNFTREKDSLLGCNIVVSEVEDPRLVKREEPPPVEQVRPAPGLIPAFAVTASRGDAAVEPSPAALDAAGDAKEREPQAVAEPQSEALEGPGKETEPAASALQPPGMEAAEPAGDEGPGADIAPDVAGEEPIEDGDPGMLANGAGSTSQNPEMGNQRSDRNANPDWGFVRQIAASFVRGLDKRRGEMSDKILGEVCEAVRQSASDADQAILEQALAKVKEARELQSNCERNLQSASRKAQDTWAEASATAVSSLLQKELTKISDGVAATLAQQLSQSKKFCEALAKGVQKSGTTATKQALEGLRPGKQLQETVGNALTDALHEALAPVFRQELRLHFETELAPMVGQRVAEMIVSFRDRMGKCLESIAHEHEQAGQRLGRDLAPIVAEELKQVERIVSQQRSSSSSTTSLTESQLDELARAVQAEVVQPLHSQIQQLSAQVQALQEHSRRLEERWQSARRALSAVPPPPTSLGSVGASSNTADWEKAQASDLEASFKDGKISDAFVRAMNLQMQAVHWDFLDSVCCLVPEGPEAGIEDWLAGDGNGCPLSMQVKLLLMLSLARQLESGKVPEEPTARKIDWISELWISFEPNDPEVASNAPGMCKQLTECLDRIPQGKLTAASNSTLRKVRKTIHQMAKILENK